MTYRSGLTAVASVFALLGLTGLAAAQEPAATPTAPADLVAPGTPAAPPLASDTSSVPAGPVDAPLPIEPEQAASSTPPSEEETTELRYPNWPMIITGGAVLVASYGASAIVAGASDRESNDQLFYPVVGPWFALHDMDCDVTACKQEGLYKGMLIADGVVQGVGVVTMIIGAVTPRSVKKPWYLIGSSELSVSPQFGTSTLGATAAGRF